MFLHTYYFQKWDKKTEINTNNFNEILMKICIILFLNDFVNTTIKWFSFQRKSRFNNVLNLLIFPITIFFFSFILFWTFEIQAYKISFFFVYFTWLVLNYIKSTIIYTKYKYASDLVKLVDPIFIINIILIAITDPIENSPERPNSVTLYEVYFRYMEFHILMMSATLIYNDKNIDDDVRNKLFSTSAVIGKYDSFRFSIILIFFHYLFIIINGVAYSIK
jgi:hypothetical protein